MRNVWPSAVVSPIARHESRGHRLGAVERVRAVAAEDEHHVDVGCVRQFLPAEAAHADHCEGDLRFERLQRGFDARVGEVRQLASDVPEIGEPEQIARSDAQQLAPLEAAEPVAPGPVVFPPVDRVERGVDQLHARRFGAELVVVGE